MLQIHRVSGRKKSAVASWNKQEVSKIFCLITSHNFIPANLLEQITQSTNYVWIIAQQIILQYLVLTKLFLCGELDLVTK